MFHWVASFYVQQLPFQVSNIKTVIQTEYIILLLEAKEDPWLLKTMAERLSDNNPTKMIQNLNADLQVPSQASADSASESVVNRRPTDLGLTQSLSKSDSNLLMSPLKDEDRGLSSCNGSECHRSSGQPSMDRSPSFATEWDEVMLKLQEWGKDEKTERHCGLWFSESVLPHVDG